MNIVQGRGYSSVLSVGKGGGGFKSLVCWDGMAEGDR